MVVMHSILFTGPYPASTKSMFFLNKGGSFQLNGCDLRIPSNPQTHSGYGPELLPRTRMQQVKKKEYAKIEDVGLNED